MKNKLQFNMLDAWLNANFKDMKGNRCTIAQFGIRRLGEPSDELRIGKCGKHGADYAMYWDQKTVKLLLPFLIRYAETGELE